MFSSRQQSLNPAAATVCMPATAAQQHRLRRPEPPPLAAVWAEACSTVLIPTVATVLAEETARPMIRRKSQQAKPKQARRRKVTYA